MPKTPSGTRMWPTLMPLGWRSTTGDLAHRIGHGGNLLATFGHGVDDSGSAPGDRASARPGRRCARRPDPAGWRPATPPPCWRSRAARARSAASLDAVEAAAMAVAAPRAAAPRWAMKAAGMSIGFMNGIVAKQRGTRDARRGSTGHSRPSDPEQLFGCVPAPYRSANTLRMTAADCYGEISITVFMSRRHQL